MKDGTKIAFHQSKAGTGSAIIIGEVVARERFKELGIKRMTMPYDIFIMWETGEASTYSEDWIKDYCEVLSE